MSEIEREGEPQWSGPVLSCGDSAGCRLTHFVRIYHACTSLHVC